MTTIAAIQQAVSERYGVTVREIVSDRRHKRICRPRHIAMYLAREMTTVSMPVIGRHFGDRDHTTVMNGCRNVETWLAIEPDLPGEIAAITNQLQPEDVAA